MNELTDIISFITSYLRKRRFFYIKITPFVFQLNGINYFENKDSISLAFEILLKSGFVKQRKESSDKYKLLNRSSSLKLLYPEKENLIYYSFILRLITSIVKLVDWVRQKKLSFPDSENFGRKIKLFNLVFDFFKKIIALIVFLILLKTIIFNKCGLDINCISDSIWEILDWSSSKTAN